MARDFLSQCTEQLIRLTKFERKLPARFSSLVVRTNICILPPVAARGRRNPICSAKFLKIEVKKICRDENKEDGGIW